jgi:hypothetical protein
MDALRASVEQAQRGGGRKLAGTPLKKKVAKTKRKPAAKAKKSTKKSDQALQSQLAGSKAKKAKPRGKKKTG